MIPCSTHTVTTSSEICPEKEEVGKNIPFDFVIVYCNLFESKKCHHISTLFKLS